MNSSFFGFFAHSGFLAALHELGIRPAQVSGASAGSIVAGLYAAGVHPREICSATESRSLRLALAEWALPYRFGRTIMNRRGATGALSGTRVREFLGKWLLGRRIEDCKRPGLAISAANISRVQSDLLREGDILDAVMASCAVPGMFATQTINGEHYWDGGIADPAPFEHWIDEPGIKTILVHLVVNAEEARHRDHPANFRFSDGLARTHQIISDELFRLKCRLARQAKKELIVLHTLTPRPGPTKLALGRYCMDLGWQTIARNQEDLRYLV